LPLHTKQSHVHCDEAVYVAAVDFPLPSSENFPLKQPDKWKYASSVLRRKNNDMIGENSDQTPSYRATVCHVTVA
jgi:hypothetical protein